MHAFPQGFPFTYLTKEMNMLESAIMENVLGKKHVQVVFPGNYIWLQ